MTPTGPAALRGPRALAFGATVLVLAAGAHVLGGGALPTLPVLIAVGLPLACAAVVLARRTRGLPTLLAALAAGQVVLHETFMGAASASCAPAHATSAGGHHATSLTCDPMPTMVGSHAAPSALMITLHVLATVATALLLAHGERLATRLATWARDLLSPLPPARVRALAPLAALGRTAAPVVRQRAATDVSRRGPPPARPALVHVTA